MRLTLRTLLAYLDEILDPADARDLGQKIEESEFASGLVHRIRSAMRKLRLGAPKLSGKGMGLDVNTVAEYLDNTLPQDRVPDFERVCLESDVHLAEVASCHQILTLVLGEPADVDPALHERIGSLQARFDAQAGEGPPQSASPGLATAPPESPPVEPQDGDAGQAAAVPMLDLESTPVTEHRSSIRLLPILMTFVVVFVLALAALVFMGPLNSDHPILGRMLADATTEEAAKVDDASSSEPTVERGNTQPTSPLADANGTAIIDSAETLSPSPKSSNPADSAPEATTPAAAELPGVAADNDVFPAIPSGKRTASTDPALVAKPDPAVAPPIDDAAAGGGKPAEGPAATSDESADAEPVARCMSNLHVLTHFDPTTEIWLRLSASDPIPTQQEVIALPTYRPQITFSSGIQMILVGPVAVRLLEPDSDGIAGLDVRYGQMLVTTDGTPNAAVTLQIGDRTSRVSLPDVNSALALEVQRYHNPGADPEEYPAHWLILAQAADGRLIWQDRGTAETTSLAAGQLASAIGTGPLQVTTESALPQWLDAKGVRPIDRDASEHLEPMLRLNRPLTISLLEQASNRLIEVRALAICSLGALGDHDVFINAFNSKAYRTYWPDLIRALQLSISQSPETAAQVRATLERLRGVDEGTVLYRFLRGYSPQQLADGGAEALVEALASESMDVRVFAYENLHRVAEKTNLYRPEFEPSRQRGAILNWRRDLERGEIAYNTPPFEVSE